MLIGRNDVENQMQLDPANACLPNSFFADNFSNAETFKAETGISDLLLSLRPIMQEQLIRDDHKFILLASLSDSLEYLPDSIESLLGFQHIMYSKVPGDWMLFQFSITWLPMMSDHLLLMTGHNMTSKVVPLSDLDLRGPLPNRSELEAQVIEEKNTNQILQQCIDKQEQQQQQQQRMSDLEAQVKVMHDIFIRQQTNTSSTPRSGEDMQD